MSVIQSKREKLNWSRVYLAKRLSVSRQTVHNWEKLNAVPNIQTMNRISKVLRLSVNKIMKDYINKEER